MMKMSNVDVLIIMRFLSHLFTHKKNATARRASKVKTVNTCPMIARANHAKMVPHASMKSMGIYAAVDRVSLACSVKVCDNSFFSATNKNKHFSIEIFVVHLKIFS